MTKNTAETEVDSKAVERYQQILAADPHSKVFAPLADAYRKMGLLKEALATCKDGVRQHPDFAGGRIALARIYLDSQLPESALHELEKAKRLAPENLAALALLGETYLHLRKTKEALASFKTLLFLSPTNAKAQNAVKKLESLTADEYEDEEMFRMQPLSQLGRVEQTPPNSDLANSSNPSASNKLLDRCLSVADAYLARHDHEKANQILVEGERAMGNHPEIVKRLKILHQRQLDQISAPKHIDDLQKPASRDHLVRQRKIQTLQALAKKMKEIQLARTEEDLDL